MNKSNPKRWYLVMVFCICFSLFSFMVAPRLGYPVDSAHDAALMIALWAPVLAILGVRAELMQKK